MHKQYDMTQCELVEFQGSFVTGLDHINFFFLKYQYFLPCVSSIFTSHIQMKKSLWIFGRMGHVMWRSSFYLVPAFVIGCGGYADNHTGAVSPTGHGEAIMKVTLSRLILFHMEQGSISLISNLWKRCWSQ